jgi:hypothetical protein
MHNYYQKDSGESISGFGQKETWLGFFGVFPRPRMAV